MKLFRTLFFVVLIITSLLPGSFQPVLAAEKKMTQPRVIKVKSQPSASTDSQTKLSKNNKKITVFCCRKGKVVRQLITEKALQDEDGICFVSRFQAEKNCGVCCRNGKTTLVTSSWDKKLCYKTRGIFYKKGNECKVENVFCCLNGTLKKIPALECKKKKGKGYKTERDALKKCGWCCVDTRVFVETPEECKKRKGHYFSTRVQADRQCRAQRQCCVKGTLYVYSKAQCTKEQGKYYSSTQEAKRQCRVDGRKKALASKQSKKKQDFILFNPGLKPVLLPDLDVLSTSVTPNCYMKIRVKNSGGPIGAAAHASARIHLSAGVGHISGKTRLTDIDPSGKLRKAGGEITYTTQQRIITPNQATLVWIDTAHHITESNEHNNGDDAVLTCKKPITWCCFKGKAWLIPKAECEKAHGTFHPTEKEAIKSCAGGMKLSPSSSALTIMPGAMQGRTPRAMAPDIQVVVPKNFDGGINITLPVNSDSFYIGETITIRYQFTEEADSGEVTFTLVNTGTGTGVGTVRASYDPHRDGRRFREIEFTLPDSVREGEYAIVAVHPPTVYGESDLFRIHPNQAQINMLRPSTGELHHSGGTLTLSYQFSRRVEPGDITFSLYTVESDTPLTTLTRSYDPGPANTPQPVFIFDLLLPPGIDSEGCFVTATHTKALGTSNIFAIQPFGEGTAMDGTYDVEIVDIFRTDDGQVKARIRARNFVDFVDIQVNDNPTLIRSVTGAGEQVVVVGEMSLPALLTDIERYAEGQTFTVTVDPLDRFHETNERNNSLTKTLYYWESFGAVYFLNYYSSSDDWIYSSGTALIPCDGSASSHHFMSLVVNNYGSEYIPYDTVEVRQSGRRSVGGHRLGSEDYDETVVFFAEGYPIPPGGMGRIRVFLSALTVFDSTLTFHLSGIVAGWPMVADPFTVNLQCR